MKNLTRPVRVYSSMSAPEAKGGAKPLPLPDKPSIAVLPFTNMSGDPEQEYFADGMAEDIITALSSITVAVRDRPELQFTYKGRAVDVKQVGRELGCEIRSRRKREKGRSRLRITGTAYRCDDGSAPVGGPFRR